MASTVTTVYVLGATGNTGGAIVDALLERPGEFRIIAAIRPSSAEKPAVATLRTRGVDVHIIDIGSSSHEQLVNELRGADAVISTLFPTEFHLQKPLAKAAKEAGVTRFIPSDWASACVPGIMRIHDMKAEIHDYIKEVGVGYTFIDIGWWSQGLALFVDPSKSPFPVELMEACLSVYGTGDVKTAVADLRDAARIVARIITDTRTLNRYVFIWAEEVSMNETIALAEKVLGRRLETPRVSADGLEQRLRDASGLMTFVYEYQRSLWIRGDNTIANAKRPDYGSALDARELYPDVKLRSLEQVMQEYAADLKERKE